VNFAVATPGSFDANATSAIPGAFGLLSLGLNGSISFNLTDSILTEGLYLYIGEVGDNGEAIASLSSVSDTIASEAVPEPGTMALLGAGLFAVAMARRGASR
jgi:hypothetical protein